MSRVMSLCSLTETLFAQFCILGSGDQTRVCEKPVEIPGVRISLTIHVCFLSVPSLITKQTCLDSFTTDRLDSSRINSQQAYQKGMEAEAPRNRNSQAVTVLDNFEREFDLTRLTGRFVRYN